MHCPNPLLVLSTEFPDSVGPFRGIRLGAVILSKHQTYHPGQPWLLCLSTVAGYLSFGIFYQSKAELFGLRDTVFGFWVSIPIIDQLNHYQKMLNLCDLLARSSACWHQQCCKSPSGPFWCGWTICLLLLGMLWGQPTPSRGFGLFGGPNKCLDWSRQQG